MSHERSDIALLRDTLAEHAATVVVPAELAGVVRERARHHLACRRALSAAAAVVAVVCCAVGVSLIGPSHREGRVTTNVALPDWPPRGTAVDDKAFVDAAMKAWDDASGQTHRLREVIFAGQEPVGPAALLLATDASGQLRLGGLVGDPAKHAAPTSLIEDKPVMAPLVAASLVHQKADYQPVLVLVTDPSVTSATWFASDGASGDCTFVDGVDILAFDDIADVPTSATLIEADGHGVQVPIG